MRVVEVIQTKRFNTKQYRWYYTIIDSDTKERLGSETTQSETIRKIDEEGWILKPNV